MIRPQEFLDQARELMQEEKEVNCRTAVSRAYYSLYHESFEFLKKNHSKKFISAIRNEILSQFRSDVNYDLVESLDYDYLGKINVNLHRAISKTYLKINKGYNSNFRQFRLDRNDADYNLQITYPVKDAKTIISDIETMIAQIKI